MRPALSACCLLGCLTPALAAEPPLQTLTIDTGRAQGAVIVLAGRDDSQQLVVTGHHAGGLARDLTRSVRCTSTPPGVVGVDAAGLVTPLKEGTATIEARSGDVSASTTVQVTRLGDDPPVNFAHQVVPIFTKFGCNAGGCHGKADGQNGFRLSLLGFEPGDDYEYVVKEARGRRLHTALPDHSLLLRKATGSVAHGGGKKLDTDSPFYRLIRRWIAQGAPYGQPNDPVVSAIEVFPRERVLDRKDRQQLLVTAHYSDGSRADVTHMTQFECNATELGEVSDTGLVTARNLPGSAAVMARFGAHVDVFRATVPLGASVEALPPARNFIDELVFARLKQLGLPPSEVCDDATFLRRVSIDITGRLPTSVEAEQFLIDRDPHKRDKLVDRLLADGAYADYFANKWSAVLRNRRKSDKDDPQPTFAFHAWIRQSLHENRPYDRFVREVLTASGKEVESPPVAWYREVRDAGAQMEDMAQLFLGQRLACARCHHHPFEKWSQQDYHGLAAFFSRVDIKDPPAPKPAKGQKPAPKPPLEVSHNPGRAEAVNPRTRQPVPPTGLGGRPLTLTADADPRDRLVDWMAAPENPFFARTLVNRYWKHFLGRGLVDPEDDLRITNPPTNPELLDALAREFVASKYDLKKLVRTICTSTTYQLSALPNEHNADDRQNFSRYLPKRLNAEVLLDAINDVTGSKTAFKGVPAETRAVQLPDNQFESYFLSVFGRPDWTSPCECERSSDATLAQCLHMFNSKEILEKVSGPRAAALAKDKRPHAARLRELYVLTLSREPTPAETKALLGFLEKKGNGQPAYEDVIWVLLNTKEFLFNH